MKKLYGILFAVLLANFSAFSQEQMPAFKAEVKRVAVFKNGYVFTYREGETSTLNGWAYTPNTPIGVMGTIWGYSASPNVKVKQLLASESEKRDLERVNDIAEVLLANEGSKIRFSDSYNSNKVYEGTYEIVSRHRNFAAPQPKNANEYNYNPDFNQERITISLKTETGIMLFPINQVRNIEIIGQPKYEKTKLSKENRLALKVEGAKDGEKVNLGVAALERGIRWIPAYRVEIKGEPVKEAKLELEAVLINELADLNNSEVYFVVGAPHFAFQDTLSPLSLNQTFAGVSSYFQTAGTYGRNASSNAIMTQQTRMGESRFSNDGADETDVAPTTSEEDRGSSMSAEQLYLYKTDQMTLKKGERTSLRLFSLTVPTTEVFEWTVADPQVSTDNSRITSGQDLSKGVWYALKIKNTTGMPLTTAPALSFRDWKPLGQDLIRFTPTNGETILRVSPATEVLGTHLLEEKSRVPTTIRLRNTTYNYDLVTVEGKLKINNVKKTPVEMAITRSITGEVLETSDTGKISRQGLNLQSVNPNSTVKWNVTVPSGEKEIRYVYKVYVPR